MNLEKIKSLVEASKKFPGAVIEYNFDLPEVEGITPDNFFGVKAVFNKNVPYGANLIYKLI